MGSGLTPRIHDTAAAGFSAGSGAYARGRPSYPQEAIDFLADKIALGPGKKVLDLAAGTGKFTALLVPTGAEVVAVEPVKEMGDQLRSSVPGVDVLEGTAEAVPLPDASVDAVTVAQAFHWFDAPLALAEIARVLNAGGDLAMLWNRRDESVRWVAHMNELIRWHEFNQRSYETVDWAAAVAASRLYTPLKKSTFRYEQVLDRVGLEDRLRSVSYIAAKPEAEREQVVALGMTAVDGMSEPFVLPYNTLVFWCSKRS
ncbi:MAG: methyltransferase domain-containing protein [Acidimicrobiia bacterium]|nr:methyltransferase domain-containing protein [Acidimicrobiia bacterium]